LNTTRIVLNFSIKTNQSSYLLLDKDNTKFCISFINIIFYEFLSILYIKLSGRLVKKIVEKYNINVPANT